MWVQWQWLASQSSSTHQHAYGSGGAGRLCSLLLLRTCRGEAHRFDCRWNSDRPCPPWHCHLLSHVRNAVGERDEWPGCGRTHRHKHRQTQTHTNTDKQTRTHRHRHAHTKTDTPQLDLALIKTTARSFYASFCWFRYSPRLCAVARAAAVAVMRPSKTENCNQRCLALLCFACMVALLPLLPPLSRLLLLSSVVFCLLACAFLSPPPPRCCYSPSSPPIPECFCLCVLVC